ncbi:MAG: D-alanyl-D-alanine endopeptidase [Gammaproteobacteria bacterium]|nr:D-alanyl-D-alanine endopeptidase [Gammaproteobacteria bacterium]
MRALAVTLSVLLLASGPAVAAPPAATPQAADKTASVKPTVKPKSPARVASGAHVSQPRVSRPATPPPAAGKTAGTAPRATSRPRPPSPTLANKSKSKSKVKGTSKRAKSEAARLAARPRAPAAEHPQPAAASGHLHLASGSALVVDQRENEVVYAKNTGARLPIASITKLMTAMVVLDARLPLDEEVEVNDEDVDWLKGSRSRLPLGIVLTRHELLYLALVSSDNRAASALGRNYPGGKPAFVEAMNRKARALGMDDSRFEDPTGLNPGNTSTAQDLVRMVQAAYGYPTIRQVTTTPQYTLALPREPGSLEFRNTNRLVRAQSWDIGLSKTGYINEAGRCLVMQADIAERPLLIVLLNGDGRYTPFADVVRLREWLQRRQISSVRNEPATRSLG